MNDTARVAFRIADLIQGRGEFPMDVLEDPAGGHVADGWCFLVSDGNGQQYDVVVTPV